MSWYKATSPYRIWALTLSVFLVGIWSLFTVVPQDRSDNVTYNVVQDFECLGASATNQVFTVSETPGAGMFVWKDGTAGAPSGSSIKVFKNGELSDTVDSDTACTSWTNVTDRTLIRVTLTGGTLPKYANKHVEAPTLTGGAKIRRVYKNCMQEMDHNKIGYAVLFVLLIVAIICERLKYMNGSGGNNLLRSHPHNGGIPIAIHSVLLGWIVYLLILALGDDFYKHGPCRQTSNWHMLIISLAVVVVYIVMEVVAIVFLGCFGTMAANDLKWLNDFGSFTSDHHLFMHGGNEGSPKDIGRIAVSAILLLCSGYVVVEQLIHVDCSSNVAIFWTIILMASCSAFVYVKSDTTGGRVAKGTISPGYVALAELGSILALLQTLTWALPDDPVIGFNLHKGCPTWEYGRLTHTIVTLVPVLYMIVAQGRTAWFQDPKPFGPSFELRGNDLKPAAGMAGERLTQDNPKRASMQFV